MNTIARTFIAGDIDGDVERKSVNNKDVAEFRIKDIGLRIAAWGDLAGAVPVSGSVLIEGKIRTRHYIKDGQDRSTTEIVASAVSLLSSSIDDSDLPF